MVPDEQKLPEQAEAKVEEQKADELLERKKAFIEEYRQLSERHGFDFYPVVEYTRSGMQAAIILNEIPRQDETAPDAQA